MRTFIVIIIVFLFTSCAKRVLKIEDHLLQRSWEYLYHSNNIPLYDLPEGTQPEYYRVTILKQEARDDIEDFSIIVNTTYTNNKDLDSAAIRQVIDLYFFSNGGVIYYTPNFRLKYLKKNPEFPSDFNQPLANKRIDSCGNCFGLWDEVEYLKENWANEDIKEILTDKYKKMKQGYITKYDEQSKTYTIVLQDIIQKKKEKNFLSFSLKFNPERKNQREALEIVDIEYKNEVASQGSGYLKIKAVDLFNFGSTNNPNSYFNPNKNDKFATLWFKRISVNEANDELKIISKVDSTQNTLQRNIYMK